MKKIKLYYIFFIIIIFIFPIKIFAESCNENNQQSDYCRIYYSNVINVCNNMEFYRDSKDSQKNTPIYKTIDYKTPEEFKTNPPAGTFWSQTQEIFPFDGVKRIYRENQNNIYKCAVLQAQKKSYKLIKELIKIDKTGAIKDKVNSLINTKLSFVKEQANREKCNISNDLTQSKKQILDQSTYEMCKYRYYLDFLGLYYNNMKNVVGISEEDLTSGKDTNKEKISIVYITEKQRYIKSEIKKEIEQTYNVYTIAFNAYSEYESFLPIHIALELVKQDFIVLREKLYKTLSPINQVVYKIINAMSPE